MGSEPPASILPKKARLLEGSGEYLSERKMSVFQAVFTRRFLDASRLAKSNAVVRFCTLSTKPFSEFYLVRRLGAANHEQPFSYLSMCDIAINTNLFQDEYELAISGTRAEFTHVTKQLKDLSEGAFALKYKPDKYYPLPIHQVLIAPISQSDGVVTVLIEEKALKLSGDAQAFQKLSAFLLSLSNLAAGEHFHLDWFANEDLLAPTTANMSFVFSLEA
jgi:hypothetical protein